MLDFFRRIERKISAFLRLDQNKKTKLKKILPGALATALIVAIVLITVFHSTDGFTTLVDVEPASMIYETESMVFTAYTLKDESVLVSENTGGVKYAVKNAGRVNPGDVLAYVYSEPIDKTVEARAEMLDACIEILEKSLSGNSGANTSLNDLYFEIVSAISSGNAGAISSNYGELLTLLNKIYANEGNEDAIRQLLAEYKAKREALSDFFKGDYVTEKTATGGYFFKNSDGYEEIYSSKDIENLTYGAFVEMTQSKPSAQRGYGKIMNNYLWYLAVPTVKGVSDAYVIGNTYDVKFPDADNRTLKMTLSDVLYDETESKSVMLFSCGVVDSDFDYLRIQRVEIVSKNISGFRIPKSAVCDQNGTKGVYILKDGIATFRKITVLYEGDGYCIVSADYTESGGYYVYIQLNDSIITDPKNMYEGKVIE